MTKSEYRHHIVDSCFGLDTLYTDVYARLCACDVTKSFAVAYIPGGYMSYVEPHARDTQVKDLYYAYSDEISGMHGIHLNVKQVLRLALCVGGRDTLLNYYGLIVYPNGALAATDGTYLVTTHDVPKTNDGAFILPITRLKKHLAYASSLIVYPVDTPLYCVTGTGWEILGRVANGICVPNVPAVIKSSDVGDIPMHSMVINRQGLMKALPKQKSKPVSLHEALLRRVCGVWKNANDEPLWEEAGEDVAFKFKNLYNACVLGCKVFVSGGIEKPFVCRCDDTTHYMQPFTVNEREQTEDVCRILCTR